MKLTRVLTQLGFIGQIKGQKKLIKKKDKTIRILKK